MCTPTTGPVLCVNSFATEDEAVEVANASPYGLAHAVLSRDTVRSRRVAVQLRAGVVYENCSQVLLMLTRNQELRKFSI